MAELVVAERPDDAAGEQDREQRRHLRADRQHDGRDRRRPVRAQEADQPHERRARARRCRLVHGLRVAGPRLPQDRELAVDQRDCLGDPRAVRRRVEPAARPRGMGERDRNRAVVLVARADALGDALDAEQPARREPADGDDQLRGEQAQLVVAPVLAEPLLLRRRRTVAPSRRRPARIAARDRRAVERLVEGVLVELEPAPQRLAGAPAPRPPLLALDDPRRLAEQVRALPAERREHGQRLERVPGVDAGAAGPLVALERRQRAVGDGSAGAHEPGSRSEPGSASSGARTTTNYAPSKRISPPPSSAASPRPVK